MKYVKLKEADKPKALAALYNHSRPLGLGWLHNTPDAMTESEAAELLNQEHYFDYLEGRIMKLDFDSGEMFVGLYDRDNGQGAAEAVLKQAGVDISDSR